MTDKTPQQILSEAADLIEARGLAKKVFTTQTDDTCGDDETNCKYCVEGAVRKAATGDPFGFGTEHYYRPAEVLLADTIRPGWRTEDLEVGETGEHGNAHAFTVLVEWNDDPERTQAEVVAALREAAQR